MLREISGEITLKNEGMEPKQKQYPAVDATGDRNKVQCCEEQYCIGTWNVRSMNHGKSIFWPRSAVCRTCSKPVHQSQSWDPALVWGSVGSRLNVHERHCSCHELYPSTINIRWNGCFWGMYKLAELIQEIRDGKSKHRHLRNQWTKMDGNGQV